jgi:aldose 1-epimerase
VIDGDLHGMAAFPLVPYCNRIAEGRFAWDGRDHQLARNFGDHPHAIHGVGWQRPWTVDAADATQVRLSLVHNAQGEQSGAWPFPFIASLTYALADAGLTITLTATNRHKLPAPMGIGMHPYFPRLPGSVLRFTATGVWRNDRNALPREHGAIPPEWDHASGVPVGRVVLDNCFTGWSGTAELGAGASRLRIETGEDFRNLQVFTPAGADFYCVEPVSHAPDAINRPGLPPDQAMRVLAPGETLRGTIRLQLLAANAE